MSYAQAYARALNDPEGFWGEAAEALHWERRWDRVLDDSRPPFYRWFTGGRLNTCYNALDRHVAERADQPALIYDSPVTGSISTLTFAELRDEVARCAGALRKLRRRAGRPGDHLHADGARGGDRDARLRAARRDPLGGVRRLRRARARDPHRRREAEADPLGVLRHRGGPRDPLQAAARRGDRAGDAQARALHHPAAAAVRGGPAGGPRSGLAGRGAGAQRLPTACRSPRPIRSTSSTPRAPPASPRAWCATTAAMPSRCTGPCRTSTASTRARCSGRPRTSAGWSATPTSSTRRC